MSFLQLHRNIQLRLVVEFLTSLASMTVLPYLAIYFTNKIGQTTVGFVLILVVLAGIFGGFVGGHYSDKIGRKKLMVAADSLTGFLFVCIAFVNSPWLDLPYVTCLLLVIAMFFMGVMGPVAQAMIIDVSTPKNRKMVFTLSYWAMNLALAVGGIIGAYYFVPHHFTLFLGVALLSFVSTLVTLVGISETYFPDHENEHSKEKSGGSMFSGYIAVLKDKLFVVFVLAGLLLQGLEEQLTNYIGVRFDQNLHSQVLFSFKGFDFHVNGIKMLGFLQTENTLLVVVSTAVVAILVKRFSDKWVLYAGIVCFAIGYFVIGLSLNPWILFAAMVVVTLGELLYVPIRQAELAELAPKDKRSSYMAVNGLIFYLAMMLAAFFVTLGAILPFWVIAGCFLVMGALSLYLSHRIMPGLENRRQLQKGA